MPKSTREIDGHSIVLLGDFNPAIIQPSWLADTGLISRAEASAAEVHIIHKTLSMFSTDLLDIQVTPDQFLLSTTKAPAQMLADLMVGIFNQLSHTPISKVGVNREVHCRLSSTNEWEKFADRYMPTAPWSGVLGEPSLRSLVAQGTRSDSRAGSILVKIEPSLRIDPGVYIAVNDHYDVAIPASADGCKRAVDLMVNNWDESISRISTMLDMLVEDN